MTKGTGARTQGQRRIDVATKLDPADVEFLNEFARAYGFVKGDGEPRRSDAVRYAVWLLREKVERGELAHGYRPAGWRPGG